MESHEYCRFKCVSLFPMMSIPLLAIFFMACVMFPLLYIVLTIQFPVFKMFLECTGGPFGSRASSRLLALLCHDISIEESDYHVALETRISSVCGFFHFFLRKRDISLLVTSNLEVLGSSIRVLPLDGYIVIANELQE